MKFIFIRHGETIFNRLGLAQGWCDSPLTEKGQEQARMLKERLAGYPIDEAYSSPSERAYDTADIVLEGRNLEIHRDKRLKELHFGHFEGLPNGLRAEFVPDDYQRLEVGFRRYGGENLEDVLARHLDFLTPFLEKDENKTILIAGHGTSFRKVVNTIAKDSLRGKFPEFRGFLNASAMIMEYREGRFEVVDIIHVDPC